DVDHRQAVAALVGDVDPPGRARRGEHAAAGVGAGRTGRRLGTVVQDAAAGRQRAGRQDRENAGHPALGGELGHKLTSPGGWAGVRSMRPRPWAGAVGRGALRALDVRSVPDRFPLAIESSTGAAPDANVADREAAGLTAEAIP